MLIYIWLKILINHLVLKVLLRLNRLSLYLDLILSTVMHKYLRLVVYFYDLFFLKKKQTKANRLSSLKHTLLVLMEKIRCNFPVRFSQGNKTDPINTIVTYYPVTIVNHFRIHVVLVHLFCPPSFGPIFYLFGVQVFRSLTEVSLKLSHLSVS